MSIKNIIDGTYKLEGATIMPTEIDIGTKYKNFNDINVGPVANSFNLAIRFAMEGYKVQFPRQATYYIEDNNKIFIINKTTTVLDIDFNESVLIFNNNNPLMIPFSIQSANELTIRNLKIINYADNKVVSINSTGKIIFDNCKFVSSGITENNWMLEIKSVIPYINPTTITWDNCIFNCTKYGITTYDQDNPTVNNTYYYINNCFIECGGNSVEAFPIQCGANTYIKNTIVKYKEGTIFNDIPIIYAFANEMVIDNLSAIYPSSDPTGTSQIRLCSNGSTTKESNYKIVNCYIPRSYVSVLRVVLDDPSITAPCRVSVDISNSNVSAIYNTINATYGLVQVSLTIHDCVIENDITLTTAGEYINIGNSSLNVSSNIFKSNLNIIDHYTNGFPINIENNVFGGNFTYNSLKESDLKVLHNIFRNVVALATSQAINLLIKQSSGQSSALYKDKIIIENNIIDGAPRLLCSMGIDVSNEFENSTIIFKNNKNIIKVVDFLSNITPTSAGKKSNVILDGNQTAYDKNDIIEQDIFTTVTPSAAAVILSNTNIPQNLNNYQISEYSSINSYISKTVTTTEAVTTDVNIKIQKNRKVGILNIGYMHTTTTAPGAILINIPELITQPGTIDFSMIQAIINNETTIINIEVNTNLGDIIIYKGVNRGDFAVGDTIILYPQNISFYYN